MTDSPTTVSESIADKPADAPVSPPKMPADGTKPADAALPGKSRQQRLTC